MDISIIVLKILFPTHTVFLQEREKKREEQKQKAEHLKEWSRPRDDMECDDLKVI